LTTSSPALGARAPTPAPQLPEVGPHFISPG
jgi:hypothetical protein